MYEQRLEPSSPRVQVSRKPVLIQFDCPEEPEELVLEELEERLAPGGTCYTPMKKTAGWGC
jgi:hypothetical protein